MLTLDISCLVTSNLPWFMDLTFQVPMQYCPVQQQTLLSSPVTSKTGCCFHFGSVFILSGVFSPLFSSSILAPTDLGSWSFSVISFCLFILQNCITLDILTASQGGTCAIIQTECCIFIPNDSSNITRLMNHMKSCIYAFKWPTPYS